MRSRAGRVLAAFAFACAVGCKSDGTTPTQVIVLVNAEAEVRDESAEVRLLVQDGDNDEVLDEVVAPDWPITLALAPRDGDASRTYTVTAEALDDEGKVVARARLASGYVEDEKRFVVLLLETSCLRVSCTRSVDTCHAGRCALAEVRPDQLGTIRNDAPDVGRLLGSAGRDGGAAGAGGEVGESGAGGAGGAGGQGGVAGTVPCEDSDGDCECPAGYEAPGGDGMDCVPVDCGAPAAPDHGSVSTSSGTTYGATASYACDSGYSVSGEAERTCAADGSWSESGPTCVDFDACTGEPVCTADFPCRDLAAPSLEYSCRGQFAEWTPSDSPDSFTTNADGTVTDARSGLFWQENVDGGTYTWEAAKTYCEDLVLPGGSDWRLPARAELESIIDFTRYASSIDPNVFPGTIDDWFWSSSPYVGPEEETNAWSVVFDNGNTFFTLATRQSRVRCVRGLDPVTASTGGGGAPPGRYAVRANGTVDDLRTGLTWQRVAETDLYPQAGAAEYCDTLPLAGDGWRLPAISELLTLVDPTQTMPAIDRIAFPGTPPEVFWTSTAHATVAGEAWNVDFSSGYSNSVAVAMAGHMRCVR